MLLAQNSAHSVWLGTKLVLSDMDEAFKIQTKPNGAKAGSFTGTGRILDERFVVRGASADGTRPSSSIKARLRVDARTGSRRSSRRRSTAGASGSGDSGLAGAR